MGRYVAYWVGYVRLIDLMAGVLVYVSYENLPCTDLLDWLQACIDKYSTH